MSNPGLRRLAGACVALMVAMAAQAAAAAGQGAAPGAAPTVDRLAAEAAKLTGQGKFKDAEVRLRQALEAARQAWGEHDARTATRYFELASSENDQRRYDEADADYRRSYELRRAILGEAHRDTATALEDLGTNLQNAGRYDAAETALRQALAMRIAAFGAEDRDVASSHHELGVLLHERGRYSEAEANMRQALATYRKLLGDRAVETVASAGVLGSDLTAQGRYAEAEGFLYMTLVSRRETLGDDKPETAIAYNELATNLAAQSRREEAEPLYRKSLEIRRAALGEEHPSTLVAYNNLAVHLAALGRYAEAEPIDRKVLEIRLRVLGPNNRQTGLSYLSLGDVVANQDRAGEAEGLFRQGVVSLSQAMGAGSWEVATARVFLGQALIKLNRLDEAKAELEGAVAADLAALGPDNTETIRARNWLAAALSARGEYDPSLASARAATAAGARLQAVSRAINPAATSQSFDTSLISFVNLAWKAGEAQPSRRAALGAESFGMGQELINTSAGQAMAQAAARIATRDPALARAVRDQQDLAARVKDLDRDLLQALAGHDTARVAALQADLAAARGRLADAERALDARFPTYRVLTAAGAIPLKEAQGLLAPRQGLLFLFSYGRDTYAMAASRNRFAWARAAAPPAEIQARMALLRCQVDADTCAAQQRGPAAAEAISPAERQGYARFDLDAAHRLYAQLVQPVEAALQGCDRLYVTTTSNLANLPLAMLVTAAPAKGSDFADPEVLQRASWLGDRYALTLLPSLAALRLKAAGGRGRGAATFEGFGDPRLGPADPIDRGFHVAGAGPRPVSRDADVRVFHPLGPGGELFADPKGLASLASLPGTRVELAAMSRMFPPASVHLTVGDAFTEPAIRRSPRLHEARIIAIATHGILPSAAAAIDEPGLVMTPPAAPSRDDDGVLTASEAASLDLTADWVILSACNTASVQGQGERDSLSSLSRAFLYAGARALMASHWRVWDTATAALTIETLRVRSERVGVSRATALQAAMRAVRTGRRSNGAPLTDWKPEWAHPSAWAAFSNIAYAD